MTTRINPFKGTGIALVTPFTQEGIVDLAGLTVLINRCIEGGVDFLVALGTTAETSTLSKDEKEAVVAHIVKTNAQRLPIVLGVGGNNTAEVCAALRHIPEGISGILSVSPYYNKPSQEGIFQHFKAISEASALPIILYNVPGRTSSNVSAQTTLRIASACSNIVATKDLTLPMLACGAQGVISVSGQGFPSIFSKMVAQAMEGDMPAARKNHYALLRFTQDLFAEGNPGGIKAALAHLGVCTSHVRLPLWKVSEALDTKMAAHVQSLRSGI
jgi:4-hydroxy-tetrahydrodipicolinate synthase